VRHVEDVREKHQGLLARAGSDTEGCNRLCELNVIEQAANVCCTTIARDAWKNGQELSVHGWIYDISDGLLKDLNFTVSSDQQTTAAYEAAVNALSS
jgi:carbonic anhydrase